MYKPPLVIFYSVSGGVGKTTIATALAAYLAKAKGPVLYISADFEKNDGVYRFLPQAAPQHDWISLASRRNDPPYRLSVRLYVYDGGEAYRLYASGLSEVPAVALPLALARLPEALAKHRLPVFYVVVDVMRAYPLSVSLGGRAVRPLDYLKKLAKLVFVASYDEHEVLKYRHTQLYSQYFAYADLVVMNKVPQTVLKRLSAEYVAVAPELRQLQTVNSAEEAAKYLRRGVAKAGGRIVNLLEGLAYLLAV